MMTRRALPDRRSKATAPRSTGPRLLVQPFPARCVRPQGIRRAPAASGGGICRPGVDPQEPRQDWEDGGGHCPCKQASSVHQRLLRRCRHSGAGLDQAGGRYAYTAPNCCEAAIGAGQHERRRFRDRRHDRRHRRELKPIEIRPKGTPVTLPALPRRAPPSPLKAGRTKGWSLSIEQRDVALDLTRASARSP